MRRQPWAKIPKKVLQSVEGDEPHSIARECLACGSVGKTRTCSGCMTARYCSTNCQVITFLPRVFSNTEVGLTGFDVMQIAHWIRGHSTQCKRADAPAAAG